MGQADIANALTQLMHDELWTIVIQFILVGIVILLLKNIIESLTGHILIRANSYICIGAPVEIYGKKGTIQKIGLFEITIEIEYGIIKIPTKSWRTSKYIILKK